MPTSVNFIPTPTRHQGKRAYVTLEFPGTPSDSKAAYIEALNIIYWFMVLLICHHFFKHFKVPQCTIGCLCSVSLAIPRSQSHAGSLQTARWYTEQNLFPVPDSWWERGVTPWWLLCRKHTESSLMHLSWHLIMGSVVLMLCKLEYNIYQ